MKKFTKIISLLMVFAISFGMLILPVSAEEDVTTEEDVIVARMYIAHNERNFNLSGHTWIYIENLSDESIKVGAYTVPVGEGVSVGTYGTSVSSGTGVYYNVEAWRYRNLPITDWVHLSKELTQSQLNVVSTKIIYSGTWSQILNCAYFAISVWNTIPGQKMMFFVFPTLHQLQIILYPSHGNGFKMFTPTEDNAYKQVGTGPSAVLVPTNPNIVS